jgi:hypothetical protein
MGHLMNQRVQNLFVTLTDEAVRVESDLVDEFAAAAVLVTVGAKWPIVRGLRCRVTSSWRSFPSQIWV